jgi:hypothetical protein
MEFAATIERAEKQIILARHGRRLLNLLDDGPVIPGDTRQAFENGAQARQILSDAEEDLREYRLETDDVHINSNMLDRNLMPASQTADSSYVDRVDSTEDTSYNTTGNNADNRFLDQTSTPSKPIDTTATSLSTGVNETPASQVTPARA